MFRKKHIVTAGCLVLAFGQAQADDSVTVNGITAFGAVDVGAAYRNHGVEPNGSFPLGIETIGIGAKNANKPVLSLSPNNMGVSNLGLKGADTFADDWTALFKVETGFNPLSGQIADALKSMTEQNGVPLARQYTGWGDSTRAGQIFEYGAFAGISNPVYGTLTAGRQGTLTFENANAYDPTVGDLSLLHYSGVPAGAGDTEDRFLDNSVKYRLQVGPARVAALYSYADAAAARSAYQLDVGADFGPFSIDAAYSNIKDAVAASPLTTNATGTLSAAQIAAMSLGGFAESNTLAATISDNTAFQIAARYAFNGVKLYGGFEQITYKNPVSPLTTHGLASGLGVGTTIGGYDIVTNNAAFPRAKVLGIFWFGGRYDVSPKLMLAASYEGERQNNYSTSAALAGCSSSVLSAQCSGSFDSVDLTALYHLTKRLDGYGALTWSHEAGGLANGYLHNNMFGPTAGLRYTF